MPGVKRSDIVFCYDAKDCIPNGDPYTGEQRQDPITGKIMVSDVALKHYVRENIARVNAFFPESKTDEIYMRHVDLEFLRSQGANFTNMSGSAAQVKILSILFKDDPEILDLIEKTSSSKKKAKENDTLSREIVAALVKKCIDVRVFGGVATSKDSNISLTGPLQFEVMNYSLHTVNLNTLQNTCVFPSDTKKGQGSIGTTSIVPYAFICANGSTNPLVAADTGATERDVLVILKNLWHGVNAYRSRSKMGQTSRLMLKINYVNPLTHVADMNEIIQVSNPDSTSYRSLDDLSLIYDNLVSLAQRDIVQDIEYAVESKMEHSFMKAMSPAISKLKKFPL